VSDVWVLDASPIIALAKVDQLSLIDRLTSQVLVPDPVATEVLAGPPTDAARRALEDGWGTRVSLTSIPTTLHAWGLGDGETAVLAVALDRGRSVAVLDDASARMCARSLGVSLIGTLGIVVRAKERGLLRSAAEVVTALRASGLHLDAPTVRAALRGIGEEWGG
jgi:predicted nucleic acid-binding protein